MAKRSPWAKQTRKTKKALIAKHSQIILPQKFIEAGKHFAKGPSTNIDSHKKFLVKNWAHLVKIIQKASKAPRKVVEEKLDLKLFDDAEVIALTSEVIQLIHSENRASTMKKLQQNIHDYLKNRKLPFDKDVLQSMVEEIYERKIRTGNPIDLKNFERGYLSSLKAKRKLNLRLNFDANTVIRIATRGKKLTQKQNSQLKKAFRTAFTKFQKKLFEDIRLGKIETKNIDEEHQKFMREITIELKKMYAVWLPNIKEKKETRKSSSTIKTLTRIERLRQYTAEHEKQKKESAVEIRDAKKSKEELLILERDSKKQGKKFDPVKYCLEQITARNRVNGERFKELFSKGMLSGNSIRRLFDSGNLSRKAFIQTIYQHGFLKEFDAKDVNALARGLAFIGPKVPPIENATKAFQSPKAVNLFKFLKKVGILDASHRGGECVTIRRA